MSGRRRWLDNRARVRRRVRAGARDELGLTVRVHHSQRCITCFGCVTVYGYRSGIYTAAVLGGVPLRIVHARSGCTWVLGNPPLLPLPILDPFASSR